ncbi:uncharacterized protein LOC133546768 isoform X2 [Nerophis ophidion]|uniref:uncharacterized protein LOC133546768 isoform X2 n=1 Tax=Nerophis ophidion TaxID=159077 RepID=UPI002ADF9437|nr:uncharacterized protein LOC133546768 isoform X2 [Nerophis ophidion]
MCERTIEKYEEELCCVKMCERTIAEYKEELSRTKEENERLRQLLEAVFKKPQVVLHRTDVCEKYRPPEQQEGSSSMAQKKSQYLHVKEEEPQPPYFKVEEKQRLSPHFIKEEKRHLVSVKSEDDEVKASPVKTKQGTFASLDTGAT